MNVEALIDKATNKNNISEDWATIMDICDIANSRYVYFIIIINKMNLFNLFIFPI